MTTYMPFGDTLHVLMADLPGQIKDSIFFQVRVFQMVTSPSVPDISNKFFDLQKSMEYKA